MEKSFDLGTLLRNHKKQFKNKPTEFANVAGGVKKRLEKNLKDRKNKRSSVFDKLRNLPERESPAKLSEAEQKLENRRLQLEKWKQEKKKRKREEALQKKKPFITGVVHPPLKFELPPPIKPKPSTSGRVTRSQTAKMAKQKNNGDTKFDAYSFAPKNATFRPPKINVKAPKAPLISKNSKKGNTTTFQPIVEVADACEEKLFDNKLQCPSLSEVDQCIPKPYPATTSPVLKIDKQKKSTLTPENVSTPKSSGAKGNKLSPYVTVSRGKNNARREMKKKLEEGLLDDDASDIDNVDHFRQQLASEIKRMTEMCETWEKIYEQTQLPDLAQEAILAAVGQARLLMSQKLAQFGVLIERCARPEPGSALVTPADLHGFWDMVFMQVENVDVRFMKLNKLREHGWTDEPPAEVSRKVAKPVMKKSKPAAGPSRLRDMIAAARKAKKEQQEQETSAPETDKKTFEAGFFCVQSPVRSPAGAVTPNHRATLLKAVLSSEAKKVSASKQSASFAMLRASLLGKSAEYDGIAPLPQSPLAPINFEATPGRSILKSAGKAIERCDRSLKIVLFDNSDTETQESTEHNREGLSVEQKEEGNNKIINRDVEENIDVGVSLINLGQDLGKENSRRKSRLTRQYWTDGDNPRVTRSMVSSMMQNIPVVDIEVKVPRSSRRSSRKILHDVEDNVTGTPAHQTPKRLSRRRRN